MVPLTDRHLDILVQLVTHAGTTLSKDALVEAGWRDVAVTDNSLEQAISALRRLFSDATPGAVYIETVPRRGYRFSATVTRSARRESDEHLDALLAPHRAWLEGKAALETLEREGVSAAHEAFERALRLAPDFAPPHIGLANAHVFRFESTRSDSSPDTRALAAAVHHAREACRIDPGLAEAWATLGFVLNRVGLVEDAIAAARRSVALEPDNWRHQLRLGFVAWGEERLRAASRALALLPGLGLAHFLAATVYVARQSFTAAARQLDAGAAAQDEQRSGRSRFNAVGLHWLRGLVLLRDGDERAARESFERELSFESAGHLYASECCAHTHYAFGALALKEGDRAGALAAFDRALALASGHVMPLAGKHALLAAGSGASSPELDSRLDTLRAQGRALDAAIAASVQDALNGDHRRAAFTVQQAMTDTPAGPQGWLLPVDPLLNVASDPEAWAGALGVLRTRAS